jgi:hypothetical protein
MNQKLLAYGATAILVGILVSTTGGGFWGATGCIMVGVFMLVRGVQGKGT